MTLADLTPAQRTVALLLTEGGATKEIAYQLGISPKTLSAHTVAVFRRTGAHSRIELANIVKAEELAALNQAITERDARIARLLEVIRSQNESLDKLRRGLAEGAAA